MSRTIVLVLSLFVPPKVNTCCDCPPCPVCPDEPCCSAEE